jgi:phosphatidylglycerol:prolipoprotein diacylglycerol transferase
MIPSFDLLGVHVSTYYLLQTISVFLLVLLGLNHNYRRGTRLPISPAVILCIALPAYVVGRMTYFVLYVCPGNWRSFFDLGSGGTMFLGVLLGGLAGLVAYVEHKSIPVLSAIDVFVPYLPLAGIVGRFGCLACGCCWGSTCTLPWAITFPKDSPAYLQHARLLLLPEHATHSLPVHPSQIYSMLAFLIIFAALLVYRSSQPAPGRLLWAFLFLYSVKRLLLDFFRADHPAIVLGLNFVQCISCVVILATFAYFAFRMFRFRTRKEVAS